MRFAGLFAGALTLAGCRSPVQTTIDWNLARLKPYVAEEPACQLPREATSVRDAVGQGPDARPREGRQVVRGFLAPIIEGCDEEGCVGKNPCCNNSCDVGWVLIDGRERGAPLVQLHVNGKETAFTGVVNECKVEAFLAALEGRPAVAIGHLQAWPTDSTGFSGALSVESVCLAKQ